MSLSKPRAHPRRGLGQRSGVVSTDRSQARCSTTAFGSGGFEARFARTSTTGDGSLRSLLDHRRLLDHTGSGQDFLATAFLVVFFAADFLAGAFFAPFLAAFFAGPFSRRSARSSAARSRVISSTESSLRRVALYSPSVTYSPKRPALTTIGWPETGSLPSSFSGGAAAARPRVFGWA